MANALSFLADPEYYSTMGDVAGNALMTAWNRAKNGEAMLTGKPIVNSLREQISAPPEQMGMDWATPLMAGMVKGTPRLFDTIGMENKGRDLIHSKAEEYAQKLKDAGVNVLDVQHSGSLAGPSSYIKIHGQPDLRISGHDKGVIGSQSVINIGSDEQFNDILSQLPKTVRKATPEDYARIEQQKIENEYPRWIASADKKLAKGKALTNSEQEAITWRNGQATGEQPWNTLSGLIK